MSQLSLDMNDAQTRPYFLWSEDLTNAQFREILQGGRGPFLQAVYMGRLLREARMSDVWQFLTPDDVATHWPNVKKHLGRRKAFWEFLLGIWQAHGLLQI